MFPLARPMNVLSDEAGPILEVLERSAVAYVEPKTIRSDVLLECLNEIKPLQEMTDDEFLYGMNYVMSLMNFNAISKFYDREDIKQLFKELEPHCGRKIDLSGVTDERFDKVLIAAYRNPEREGVKQLLHDAIDPVRVKYLCEAARLVEEWQGKSQGINITIGEIGKRINGKLYFCADYSAAILSKDEIKSLILVDKTNLPPFAGLGEEVRFTIKNSDFLDVKNIEADSGASVQSVAVTQHNCIEPGFEEISRDDPSLQDGQSEKYEILEKTWANRSSVWSYLYDTVRGGALQFANGVARMMGFSSERFGQNGHQHVLRKDEIDHAQPAMQDEASAVELSGEQSSYEQGARVAALATMHEVNEVNSNREATGEERTQRLGLDPNLHAGLQSRGNRMLPEHGLYRHIERRSDGEACFSRLPKNLEDREAEASR